MRDGIDYEFTIVFDINIKHQAIASKDRTNLFMNKPDFTITPTTGQIILDWLTAVKLLKSLQPFTINTQSGINNLHQTSCKRKHPFWSRRTNLLLITHPVLFNMEATHTLQLTPVQRTNSMFQVPSQPSLKVTLPLSTVNTATTTKNSMITESVNTSPVSRACINRTFRGGNCSVQSRT